MFDVAGNASPTQQQMDGNATGSVTPRAEECASYVRRQSGLAEIAQGQPLNNEYELIAFTHFTFHRVYPVELGLGKRVVEKPIGFRRKDLLEALLQALESLNATAPTASAGRKYSLDDFLEGIYRTEPTTGTQYELYFRGGKAGAGYTKVTLMRPFAPLQTLATETLPAARDKEVVHIVVPLSGRTAAFQNFMDKFVKIALRNDRRSEFFY